MRKGLLILACVAVVVGSPTTAKAVVLPAGEASCASTPVEQHPSTKGEWLADYLQLGNAPSPEAKNSGWIGSFNGVLLEDLGVRPSSPAMTALPEENFPTGEIGPIVLSGPFGIRLVLLPSPPRNAPSTQTSTERSTPHAIFGIRLTPNKPFPSQLDGQFDPMLEDLARIRVFRPPRT